MEEQKYACMSFVDDNENKSGFFGVKIRGGLNTLKESEELTKVAQLAEHMSDTLVDGMVGKWMPINQDLTTVKIVNMMLKNYKIL
jgi:hypothetical protein